MNELVYDLIDFNSKIPKTLQIMVMGFCITVENENNKWKHLMQS